MSIRNATIAMRRRKIESFEQERIALMARPTRRHSGPSGRGKTTHGPLPDTASKRADRPLTPNT